MTRRIHRWVKITGLLAFAIACTQPGVRLVGEFPLALHWANGDAWLLTYFEDIHIERYQEAEARLFRLTRDYYVDPIETFDFPTLFRKAYSSGATSDSRGVSLYTLAHGVAHRIDIPSVYPAQGKPQIHEFVLPFFFEPSGLDYTLRVVGRAEGVHWVMPNTGYWNHPKNLRAPLLEFGENEAVMLESNVLWAQCDETSCEQLRLEEDASVLRLYSMPVTSALYLRPVTSVPVIEPRSQRPPAPASGGYYRVCERSKTETTILVTDLYFSLSLTAPSLKPVTEAAPKREAVERSCETVWRGYLPLRRSMGMKQQLRMPDGGVLSASPEKLAALPEPGCNCGCQPMCKCDVLNAEFGTRIQYVSDGVVEQSFLLHPQQWTREKLQAEGQ